MHRRSRKHPFAPARVRVTLGFLAFLVVVGVSAAFGAGHHVLAGSGGWSGASRPDSRVAPTPRSSALSPDHPAAGVAAGASAGATGAGSSGAGTAGSSRNSGGLLGASPGRGIIGKGNPTSSPTPTPTHTSPPPTSTPVELPVADIFGASSFWRQNVTHAPVGNNSGGQIAGLVNNVVDRYGGVAAFNAHAFPNAVWIASASTPRVNVAFNNCQGKTYTPPGLTGPGGQFTAVPIPSDAVSAAGSDNELTVWSPSSDQLWEFWEAGKHGSSWNACWGGRIDHVSTAPGYFGGGFGAAASGLSLTGGTIGLAEIRSGEIDHALVLDIPETAAWPAVSWPAQRTDGGTPGSNAIPEGTRLRLDPSVNVDQLAGLTPIGRIIARAAQQYGFIVTDTSGAVSVIGESGVPDRQETGTDPWLPLEQGVPDYLILKNFPWSHLQALPQNWGQPGH